MVRSYTRKKDYEPKKEKVTKPFKIYSRILVFDTETTPDQFQKLKIGYFKLYENKNIYTQGLFYHEENLTKKDLKELKDFSIKHNTDIYKLNEFIYSIIYRECYLKETLILGFNLAFDLSRLALSVSEGRKWNRGCFSFKLSKNKEIPRIKIDNRGDRLVFYSFLKPYNFYKEIKHNNGIFLDISNLACILQDKKSLSLKEAGKLFNAKIQKTESGSHGIIDEKYIQYCINDVEATYSLYEAVLKEYKEYKINADICKIYSQAGLGKFALKQMGIKPLLNKQIDFSPHLQGKLMSAYYGGRTEIMYRKKPIKTTVLDFRSMYPSVFELMDEWDFVIAEKILTKDVTNEIKSLLKTISLNTLTNQGLWKKFNILVKVIPEQDYFPIRKIYLKNSRIPNIGINYLTLKQPIYYALPDIISSYIKTGKMPRIIEAIKFIPENIQDGLNKTTIRGLNLNPIIENPIKTLIEKRKEFKDKRNKKIKNTLEYNYLDNLQRSIKIMANSVSYGIFVEMHKKEINDPFEIFFEKTEIVTDEHYEIEGEFFNPVMAVMLTAGARLLLTMAEVFTEKENKKHYYTDTDSMFVSPEIVPKLMKFFQKLSPYSDKATFFEIEDGKEDVWFYGISSKRYVLYELIQNKIEIIDCKLHGLGHLKNPFDPDEDKWHDLIWEDILKVHYKKYTKKDLKEKYNNFFAISSLNISTPNLLDRFKKLNKGKDYQEQIKPFNFMCIGIKAIGVKPIAPFSKDSQEVPYKDFIDYETGNIFNGEVYWGRLDEVIFAYLDHKEHKFEGDEGWLKRKHIVANKVLKIGKEINNLEKHIIKKVYPNIYMTDKEKKDFVMGLTIKEAKQKGIPKSTLMYIKKKIREEKDVNLDGIIYKLTKI